MADRFIINGGRPLSGTITVQGSKNAALETLAAAIITDKPCHFKNVPEITDVHAMLDILKSIGVSISKPARNEYILTAKNIIPENLDTEKIGQIRASVVIMGGLAARTKKFWFRVPGGDKIGSRPLMSHFDLLTDLGYSIKESSENIIIEKKSTPPEYITLSEISVTATINALIALSRSMHTTTLYCAAQDYSVIEVCWFLESLGVSIKGIGTHTLTITGITSTKASTYTIMPDPVEIGTLIALGVATRSSITIASASIDFLRLELHYFKKMGINLTFSKERPGPNNHYKMVDIGIEHHAELKPIRHIHNMPAPGIIPDLIPPFAVLLTQASGTSLVHDWMYEGRLRYIGELARMGANVQVLDPHRAVIIGPSKLYGKTITSFDIRAGATLVIAALVAAGKSSINDIYHIDRGYEQLDYRLASIGADIKRS